MWWLLLLLLLLLAVLLAPLVWGVIQVSKLRFGNPCGQIVGPEEVPEMALKKLERQVEPLLGVGFEYLGMRREERGSEVFWQAFLNSAEGRVWAVAEEADSEVSRRASLLSFGSDGAVAITRDGEEGFGEREPQVFLRQESFASALEQAESHAALLNEANLQLAPLEPELFLKRFERLSVSGLEHLFDKGWMDENQQGVLKVALAKLPVVAFYWLKDFWSNRQRKRVGQSWLLEENLMAYAEKAPEEEQLVSEQEMEPDSPSDDQVMPIGADSCSEAEVAEEGEKALLVAEALPVVDSGLEDAVAAVLAANEKALKGSAPVEALPLGPIDGPEFSHEEVLPEESEAEVLEQVADESVEEATPEEPAIPIPEEDGLPRDLALYQKQASEKSWAYWLGGFGGRAALFVGLLGFALWMAVSSGWGGRILLFGFIALLVHEMGHTLAMVVRRSWDWSHFLIPVPHPMSAKPWKIRGGWGELFTIIAGPLPGFLIGWSVLLVAYFGRPFSDSLLDYALASLVVNGFTLLPFSPLDGGRLLDLALLRRVPGLRTVGLVVTGLLLLTGAALGGGIPLVLLALLVWSGIPLARKKSKLLPWLRANSKDNEEERLLAAFAVTRERSQRKKFRGAAGLARLDELMGLGGSKGLGRFGVVLTILFLLVAWVSPLALPLASVAKDGKRWLVAQKEGAQLAAEYLGPIRAVDAGQTNKKEVAHHKLTSWAKSLAANRSQPETAFKSADLTDLRGLAWNLAPEWIAVAPAKRHQVATEAVRTLKREATLAADSGESASASRDLISALSIIYYCEPRHSLESWVAWLELERELNKEVEDISSRYELPEDHLKWFEGTWARCPAPPEKKLQDSCSQRAKTLASELSKIAFGKAEMGSQLSPWTISHSEDAFSRR